jgi:two-component system response regulator FlrC
MAAILVVDDEAGIREFLCDALELDGHDPDAASSGEEALARLSPKHALLITDLKMPGMTGIDLLRAARNKLPDLPIVVLTAHGTVDIAVEAMKLGAFDFLEKPLRDPAQLHELVRRALATRPLAPQGASLAPPQRSPVLSHGAKAMEPVVQAINKVSPTDATVLLLGESGTGKEVAARTIHEKSRRGAMPLMAINCAALTENLLESELFGHEKGAFTGAESQRKGRVELAEGGTFFLDEVGELQPKLQAKLLRVLQEKCFERVGGTETLRADVRWVAATNRDLPAMIRTGEFREDLYHRLAVFPIRLPALRDRPEDLLPIAEALLNRVSRELGRELSLSADAKAKIIDYSWPGNVRELANAVERASILAEHGTIAAADLWLEATLNAEQNSDAVVSLAESERATIARALEAVSGNRRKAAKLLGIGERTLYDKIKRYGL